MILSLTILPSAHSIGITVAKATRRGGDDESIAGNFKVIAREADLSPKTSGKKGRKPIKGEETIQPIKILLRRKASQTK